MKRMKSFASRARAQALRAVSTPNAPRKTLLALLVGAVAASYAQTSGSRFESLERDAATRATGTNLPLQRPSLYPSRSAGPVAATNARVGGLAIEVEHDGLPADGQTANRVTVRLFDAQGAPLAGESLITVEYTGGRLLLPGASTDEFGPGRQDADALLPGVQVPVKDGMAQLVLLAPSTPQDVRLRVTAGSQEASGVVSYVPDLRDWLAAGVVDGVINLRHLGSSAMQQARPEDGFEREMRAWERSFANGRNAIGLQTAFFLKGKIKGEYLLTAAYDSDKETRQRLAGSVLPEEFYPVYGDAAVRGTEVASASRLFVRVDNGKSFLLFGDFSTASDYSPALSGTPGGLKLRDLGVYNRTLTGLKWHRETARYAVNAFAARDNLKQVIDEFPGRGVSGPYALSNGGALLGTERVELITRDRNQRSLVLASVLLSPLVDYTYEPFSGRLLFKQPVPSVDENLNPIFVRVTYELEQGGPAFWVGGADGQIKLNSQWEVGGSVVKDDNPLAPYSLASANVGWKLGPGTLLVAEVARTRSEVNTSSSNTFTSPALANKVGEIEGTARRIELRHEDERLTARAWAGRSDPEFNNPAASLNGGRVENGARGEYRITETLRAYGQALQSEDLSAGGQRRATDVGVVLKLSDTLELDAGVRSVREKGSSATPVPTVGSAVGANDMGLSGGGFYGVGTSAIGVANGGGFINTGGFSATGNSAAPVDADTAHVGLRWKPTPLWTVAGEVETAVSGERQHRLAVGADYLLSERAKLYGRYESQSGLASVLSVNPADKSSALVFGVSSSFLTNSTVYTEYRLRDAIDDDTARARDLQLATGVQQVINVRPGLRYTANVERLRVMGGDGREGFALAGGVEYTASERWKLASRLEYRRVSDDPATPVDDRQDSWLSTLSVARKLDRDWTGLVRNYLLASDDQSLPGRRVQDRFQVGAAYRPVDMNRFDALLKLERRIDNNAELLTGAENTRATIVSAHGNYHPRRPLWLAGRLAAKWQDDPYGRYTAYLASGRITYDLTDKWDTSFLTSLKWSPQGSSRQWAQGLEVGYALQQNLWLSVGANWTGFSDDELVGADYTRRGVYLRLRYKFDEELIKSAATSAQRLVGPAPAKP